MSSFLKFAWFKMPSKLQWAQFFKILNKKERFFFFLCLILFLGSGIFLASNFYFEHTFVVPKEGGIIREGILGQPQFINPLLSWSSDIDRDLVELVFSGLMTYNKEGEIIPDLIDGYEFKDNGKTFEFSLKPGVKWQDGESLTCDDVIFTVNLVQDSKYLSPLRPNWQGIEIEKISEERARFKLIQPYSGFLENLTRLKILPKHIWENIPSQNLALIPELNLFSPVGSGAFSVEEVKQRKDKFIESVTLKRNENYFGKKPELKKIIFLFFEKKDGLISALKNKKIQAVSPETLGDYFSCNFENSNFYSFEIPNYFVVFFNINKKLFSEKEVRQALARAINKEEIIEQVLNGQAKIVNSPILPDFYGLKEPKETFPFNPEQAKEILEKEDFLLKDGQRIKTIEKLPEFQFKKDLKFGDQGLEVKKLQECLAREEVYPDGEITGYFGSKTKEAVISFQEKYKSDVLEPYGLTQGTGKVLKSTREKLNEVCWPAPVEEVPLSFSLTTVNNPNLIKAAQILKKQWEKIGVPVEIKVLEVQELKKIIRERDFESLLFGETLGGILDPLPFWHSAYKVDPGLNLASYENKKVDELLEKARIFINFKDPEREKILEEFQEILIADSPVIFLYRPNYLYLVSSEIKGIETGKIMDPSGRFLDIEGWYVKTKRVWQ
ncbi:MAG: hypothetical protein CO144_01200 [Candidatus Nealsonbacteria bacterium CG_4_9_14_3_um_filter_35_11]|uniref:Solute-binding protein family 5 domain-containing protein n=2 Tax=Candidatus Nealsoniibacteriota TaxID=1817911 RepID=A0A2M7DAU7_9BACT|nr:MAG: hypothetical protein COV62_00750 [Candidatus Nealsonbacteria bacterium CG11_big_fil_rev_8_21_14_0_20_35_11]PIV45595.1 MAG: hypothetical protein COS24_01455 [Candidatus Nealsonbacteria bacterium CG02_land_8_20_14_3_00_34_20]PIW92491.1 MAG: hypothetical protein COZ88_01990 [Candidatus Nealsonbacteria bacterium CG_4_8_14_3_um_filter_34_13]PIZ89885.1 MAG: hypothetical protein COX88_01435 [Candidatus Nealsonbacteria bacterium CG_4_10_14_0_2_um_filter_35_20]PJA84586.1 MAG: hypothetical protei